MAKTFEVRILFKHDIKVDDDVLDFYLKQNNGDPRKPYAMRLEKIGNAYYCPICHSFKPSPFSIRFCDWCGQYLYWSE